LGGSLQNEAVMAQSNTKRGIPGTDRFTSASNSPDKAPFLGGLAVGFVGSLCCGGGLIFGAIGLGAAYSALGVARYIPEALAAATILIALLNWLYYRRKAQRMRAGDPGCNCSRVRQTMLWSAFAGLAMMAGSFVLLEWLNHGVVHAAHFMHSPEFATALIPGVPNSHLGYIAATFLVLPLLAMLPLADERRAATTMGQTPTTPSRS
jgi:hypothetical protein